MKPTARKESLALRFSGAVFIGIPLGISRTVLTLIRKREKRWVKWLIAALICCISTLFAFGFGSLFDWLEQFLKQRSAGWSVEIWTKFCLCYLSYLVITLPVFLGISYLVDGTGYFKDRESKREPTQERMRIDRLQSNYHKVYLGHGLKTGQALYLTNDQRQMHCEVVGSTGTGKTESVLLPMLAHDLTYTKQVYINGKNDHELRKGAIIVDGKGDLELRNKIRYIVHKQGREDDFYFFSLAHPKKSNSYNPLFRGNPTELKDKLINSMAWSEEFYRRMAEQAALTLLNAIHSCGKITRFGDLYNYLTDLEALKKLSDGTQDKALREDLRKMVTQFKENHKFLAGLISDLFITSRSEFSKLLDTDKPEIDLLSAYQNHKIVYFALDLQKYADTSRRLGRMIIQDIRTVSSHIQAHVTSMNRHFFPVFIDDASSFLDVNFIDFLSKCRASGLAVTILHQSPADLVYRGIPTFAQQVIENTNIKIILRQDDPNSVEKFTKIAGTRKTMISTYQTEEKIMGKGLTGAGSIREGQTFRIEPDLIRALKRGEAAVIWKNPSLLTEHAKLDFFGYSSYPDEFEKRSQRHSKKSKPVETQEKAKPASFDNPFEIIKSLEEGK